MIQVVGALEAEPVAQVARALHLLGDRHDAALLTLLASQLEAVRQQCATDGRAALGRRYGQHTHRRGVALRAGDGDAAREHPARLHRIRIADQQLLAAGAATEVAGLAMVAEQLLEHRAGAP